METDKIKEAQDIAAKFNAIDQTSTGPGELKVDPHYIEDPKAKKVVEFALQENLNLLVWGPTGCGKSSLVINVMARLKRKAEIFNCDVETCTDNLIGKPWSTLDSEGKSMTSVSYGTAVRAYRDGHVLLLEEADHALADIHASLHRIMEEQSDFYNLTVGDPEIIPKNPLFSVIATSNTIGTGEDAFLYAGTKVLNQAFLSRFHLTVKLSYLDEENEIKVIMAKTGISRDVAAQMVHAAHNTRDAADPNKVTSDNIAIGLSTRDLLSWARTTVGMGVHPTESAKYAFLDRTNDTDRAIIKIMVDDAIR